MELAIILLVLIAAAGGCFGVAAFADRQPKVNMIALGLLLFAAAEVIRLAVRVA